MNFLNIPDAEKILSAIKCPTHLTSSKVTIIQTENGHQLQLNSCCKEFESLLTEQFTDLVKKGVADSFQDLLNKSIDLN